MTDAGPIAAATRTERLALCDLLDGLDDDEWERPSLCAGWTVHHVAAHLALATLETLQETILGVIKARGNFDRMTRDMAIERAERFTPPELIEQIRSTATSTRRAPMSSPLDPLVDVLVHGQDIARPLRRAHASDPEHVVPALAHAVESRWYGGAKRFIEVQLVATDISWTGGTGTAEVRGPAGDLLMMATGRTEALAALTGEGVPGLRNRLMTTKGPL